MYNKAGPYIHWKFQMSYPTSFSPSKHINVKFDALFKIYFENGMNISQGVMLQCKHEVCWFRCCSEPTKGDLDTECIKLCQLLKGNAINAANPMIFICTHFKTV